MMKYAISIKRDAKDNPFRMKQITSLYDFVRLLEEIFEKTHVTSLKATISVLKEKESDEQKTAK